MFVQIFQMDLVTKENFRFLCKSVVQDQFRKKEPVPPIKGEIHWDLKNGAQCRGPSYVSRYVMAVFSNENVCV
jgi:hypothetical protein